MKTTSITNHLLQVLLIVFIVLTAGTTVLFSQEQVKLRFEGNDIYTFDSSRIDMRTPLQNVFIGRYVGILNGIGTVDTVGGTKNVGIGDRAMQGNTTGHANIGVGFSALRSNINGYSNTAMGFHTMGQNTSGSHNTAVGEGALGANTTGGENTAFGDDAILRKITGHFNTAIGKGALEYLINGNGNVALGYRAGSAETGSDKLYIHNDSTGIGQSLIYGEFDNDIVRINGELQIGTAYKFPTSDGPFGRVLSTDGAGQVLWTFLNDDDEFNELTDSLVLNYPYLEVYQAGVPVPNIQVDLAPLIDDDDNDPMNELQTLSVAGGTLSISDGNSVSLPGGTSIIDDDGDTRVEAVDFLFGDDKIDFTVDGNNFIRMANNRLGFLNTNNNIVISDPTSGASGNDNTFIGHGTGNASATGDNNTMIGSGAGASLFSGSGNVFVGKDAGSGQNVDNRLFIENSTSTSPLIYGEFDNDRVGVNGSLAVGHQSPSARLHVMSNSTETARFESIDNVFVSFYKAGVSKGLIQSLFDDFLFGKTTGSGTGSVQLYNQGNIFSVRDNGTYRYGHSSPTDDLFIEMRRDGNQHGFLHIKDDAFNGRDNNLHIGKSTSEGNVALENNGEYIFLEPDGDVGIGTNFGITIPDIHNKLRIESENFAPAFSSNVTYSGNSDIVAIEAISTPATGYGVGGTFEGGWRGLTATGNGQGYAGTSTGLIASATGSAGIRIGLQASATGGATNWAGYFNAGNVYVADSLRIGTIASSGTYKLSVDGKIIAEELKIQDSGDWPDYVFADDYTLMPLDEVEKAIKQNRHLPGVPSATEVEANGIEVGDMQKKMMEKIEELTLHVIALQKRIVELENQN